MLLRADYIFLLLFNIDWNLNERWTRSLIQWMQDFTFELKHCCDASMQDRSYIEVKRNNYDFRTEIGCVARSAWQAEAKICSWCVNCQLVTPLSIYCATTDAAFMHIPWIVRCKCEKLIIILFIILMCSRSFGWRTTSRKWVIKQWLFQLKVIIIAPAHLF